MPYKSEAQRKYFHANAKKLAKQGVNIAIVTGKQAIVTGKQAIVTGKPDRKSTRLNSSHSAKSRMPSSA